MPRPWLIVAAGLALAAPLVATDPVPAPPRPAPPQSPEPQLYFGSVIGASTGTAAGKARPSEPKPAPSPAVPLKVVPPTQAEIEAMTPQAFDFLRTHPLGAPLVPPSYGPAAAAMPVGKWGREADGVAATLQLTASVCKITVQTASATVTVTADYSFTPDRAALFGYVTGVDVKGGCQNAEALRAALEEHTFSLGVRAVDGELVVRKVRFPAEAAATFAGLAGTLKPTTPAVSTAGYQGLQPLPAQAKP